MAEPTIRGGANTLSRSRRLARWFGLTTDEGAERRLVRFGFALRALLVAVTPLFFLLPTRQYGSAHYWLIPVILELGLMAWLAWKHMWLVASSRWRFAIHALDLAFVFAVFILTTSAENGTAVGYLTVVVVGTFQLQTYGPVLTSSTLSGVWDGFGIGLLSAGAYLLSLRAVGRPFNVLFSSYQVSSTISRMIFYVVIGLFFGILRDFVVYNRSLEKRAYDILHNRGLSNISWLTDDLLALSRQGEFSLHRQLRSGELTADLNGIGENLKMYVAGLRRIGAGLPPGAQSVVQVCDNVVTNQLHSDFRHRDQPVVFSNTKDERSLYRAISLPNEHAVKLDKMLRHAITNCRNHAEKGEVSVAIVVDRVANRYSIEVRDQGPRQEKDDDVRPYVQGTGHADAERDAAACGWAFEFVRGSDPGVPSLYRVSIPLRPDDLPDETDAVAENYRKG